MNRIVIALMLFICFVPQGLAVQPDEILPDPVLEQRARSISAGLRCLVCQNQSIDESDADLAKDLRLVVRERLVAGDSDTEIIDYVVARYGEFVLLNPTVSGHNLVLWFTTPVIFVIGALALLFAQRKNKPVAKPLNPREQAQLDALLATEGENNAKGEDTKD